MLLKGLSFRWLETDSTQSFSLDLTSLGNPGPASVPHPRSQAGIFLVALWGFKSMPSPPGEDRVGSKEKPGSCPGWVTVTPAKVPEPQSWWGLRFEVATLSHSLGRSWRKLVMEL